MSTLRTEERGDVLVVYFNEARILDEILIGQIEKDLLSAADRVPQGRLLLNFRGVGFMSSAMIGRLIMLNKKCKDRDIKLHLCSVAPAIMGVFKITGLGKGLSVFDDEAKAIAAFDKKGWFG